MTLKVLALGGDGIGPEVVDASIKLLDVAAQSIALGTESSVGPPLTGIGQRLTSEEILRSIVDPTRWSPRASSPTSCRPTSPTA